MWLIHVTGKNSGQISNNFNFFCLEFELQESNVLLYLFYYSILLNIHF